VSSRPFCGLSKPKPRGAYFSAHVYFAVGAAGDVTSPEALVSSSRMGPVTA